VGGYKVYYLQDGNAEYTLLTEVPSNPVDSMFIDIVGIYANKYIFFKLKAIDSNGIESSFSDHAVGWANGAIPHNVTATKNVYSDRIHLSWSAVQIDNEPQDMYAANYDIYRADNCTNSYYKRYSTSNLTYDITDKLVPGYQYCFKVVAVFRCREDNGEISTNPQNLCETSRDYFDILPVAVGSVRAGTDQPSTYLPAPNNVRATDGECFKIDVNWDTVSGAQNYKVYRSQSSFGPYTRIYTTSDTSYSDTANIIVSTGYWYKVSGIDSSSGVEGYLSNYDGGYAAARDSLGLVCNP
jgi:fibronectin type 3 domain-containing protein